MCGGYSFCHGFDVFLGREQVYGCFHYKVLDLLFRHNAGAVAFFAALLSADIVVIGRSRLTRTAHSHHSAFTFAANQFSGQDISVAVFLPARSKFVFIFYNRDFVPDILRH